MGSTKSDLVKEKVAPCEPLYVVSLVDDDDSIRKSVSRLLASDGFSVVAFSEPKQFLEHLATTRVEVVVLDIWMGEMTGMELFVHLCAKSPKTRVIFITGQEDPAARATVLQAGAFAFFLKPFDDTAFLSAVRRAFDNPAVRPATATDHTGLGG